MCMMTTMMIDDDDELRDRTERQGIIWTYTCSK